MKFMMRLWNAQAANASPVNGSNWWAGKMWKASLSDMSWDLQQGLVLRWDTEHVWACRCRLTYTRTICFGSIWLHSMQKYLPQTFAHTWCRKRQGRRRLSQSPRCKKKNFFFRHPPWTTVSCCVLCLHLAQQFRHFLLHGSRDWYCCLSDFNRELLPATSEDIGLSLASLVGLGRFCICGFHTWRSFSQAAYECNKAPQSCGFNGGIHHLAKIWTTWYRI